ncbi:MAG TPA: twin-arginine translocase subunit TatC [Bryobacteraceae bacterium]|nr:twin-arginine translocase subunit TatC [Bryobacteraceae bacterium]
MNDEKPGANAPEAPTTAVATVPPAGAIRKPPPPPPPPPSGDEPEDEGMLRMSFLEHLEELRTRIIRSLMGLGVAFVASLVFANYLWDIIVAPATDALKHLHVEPPQLVMTVPMEGFSIIWMKLPLLCSIFLASPWIVYQIWAFISPGLYKKEKRLAAPFILATAGLFILGGCFAYFLAFRYGLTFLLGIGMSNGVKPMVTITEYFDLFVNVTLGVGLVFEMPVLIFMLTLLRVVSPRFLIRHSRYAILAIVIIAAIVTPTPDVFNLMLFAVPMCALYFVGVFAGYLLVLRREGRKFPWKKVLMITGVVLAVGAGVVYLFIRLGYHLIDHWPYLTK